MKSTFLLFLVVILFFSCEERKDKPISIVKNPSIDKRLTQKQKDSIEEARYWELDTLLLEEYISKNGHTIQKRGSESGFMYSISTTSKKGIAKDFQLTDNSYVASHSFILWDNEDFIFVRYGCGAPCWGGLVLSLNDEKDLKDFQMYLYEDSINNLVVYPDKGWESLILENFSTNRFQKEKFDFCEQATMPFYVIDTIIKKSPTSVEVEYRSQNCELKKKKIIEIK